MSPSDLPAGSVDAGADRASRRWAEHARRVEARATALLEAVRNLTPSLAAASRVTLELGCGHGHFLAGYAAKHAGDCCVGIDYCNDRILRSERKRLRAQLPNLHFVRAEALQFLAALPAGIRLGRIFILFPDPWPKRRHHKHRLVSPALLAQLTRHTVAGAELFFRSDAIDYVAAVERILEAGGEWKPDPALAWPFEEPTVFQQKAARYWSVQAIRRS